MTWGELRSGADRVLSNADSARAEQAIAEILWNALDAEARNVAVTVESTEMGAATRVVVEDDGHGIPHRDSADLFLTEGDSWKKEKRFSPTLRRPMHGQLGRGRLLSYAIADEIEWSTTHATNGRLIRHTIIGRREKPAGFDISGPVAAHGPTGTRVAIRLRESQKAAQIGDDGFSLKVLELMSESLAALPDASVTWCGEGMDPFQLIDRRESVEMPPIGQDVLRGHPDPELVVIEWSSRVGSQRLQLCDASGASLTEFKPPVVTCRSPLPYAGSIQA